MPLDLKGGLLDPKGKAVALTGYLNLNVATLTCTTSQPPKRWPKRIAADLRKNSIIANRSDPDDWRTSCGPSVTAIATKPSTVTRRPVQSRRK